MKKVFLLILLAGLVRGACAQRLSADSALYLSALLYPQEKVYLHTDKEKYFAGDTLWFKSYLFSGLLPSNISTALHVELLNGQGQLVMQKFYPVIESSGMGELELKDTLAEGVYTVRAYSTWMMNFDPAFFFTQHIMVYNSTRRGKAMAVADGGMDLRFFPEGGDFVMGVATRVAFKAVDESGRPVAVRGSVVDESGVVLTAFQSVHDGMGTFELAPVRGHTYRAIVLTTGGEKEFPLQGSMQDGVVMNVNNMATGVLFTLRTDSGSIYIGQPLSVVAHMYGHKVFKATTTMSRDVWEINGFIPYKDLETGVMQLTLFDQHDVPLAERVVFVRPHPYRVTAILRTDTVGVGPKGLNAWRLEVADSLKGNFSVSVTDADVVIPGDDRSSVFSGLLLQGDVRGHVYNAGWYFRDDADSTIAALDLVMLTHGWRRFNWAALTRGQFPEIVYGADTGYLHFGGVAYNESGRRVLRNTELNVLLRGSDSTQQMYMVPVDSAGRFELDNLVFFDNMNGYVKLNKKGASGKDVSLELDRPPTFPLVVDTGWVSVMPNVVVDTSFKAVGQREQVAQQVRAGKAKQLSDILIKGKKKSSEEELDARYATGLFSNPNGYSFDMMNNPMKSTYSNIFLFLQGRVPGLQISGDLNTNPVLTFRSATPTLYFNEQQVTSDMLTTVSVGDIAYVKFLRPPFAGAPGNGPGGAIVIYTKKGSDIGGNVKGLNTFTLSGYSRIREYYSPRYETAESREQPDYRTTLLWVPYVVTDADYSTGSIRFYNNDSAKRFRVIVEGMDEMGNLFHLEQVIE